jgi:hypothetical protein
MLYDGGGISRFNATQYTQGAGIHLSVGILINRGGSNSYYSRLGPTQGEGHDLSVGEMIDCKGENSYTCSGGQGIGLTNSFAMFIDEGGHNCYTTTEAIGQGTGTWARGFGGIGVFINEDGNDNRFVKQSPGDNNSIWTQGTYGTGISLPAKPVPGIPAEETTYTPDTSKVKRPIKDVFADARVWQVGEARNKTRRARKELITRGREAAEYMAKEQFNTEDGLALEAITEFAQHLPDTIAPFLFQGLHDTTAKRRLVISNCAYLIGQAKIKNGVDSLLAALKLPGFRPRWAIGAFGEIGDTKVVPLITSYLKDSYEPTRIVTAATLGKLKDPRGIPALIGALDDPMFTVRSAAEQALVDNGDTSLSLVLAVKQWTPRQSIHVIRLVGALGEKLDTVAQRAQRIAVRKMLTGYLDDSNPALRGVAVEALGKMIDDPTREMLKNRMASEADEYVLGKYKEVLYPVSSSR